MKIIMSNSYWTLKVPGLILSITSYAYNILVREALLIPCKRWKQLSHRDDQANSRQCSCVSASTADLSHFLWSGPWLLTTSAPTPFPVVYSVLLPYAPFMLPLQEAYSNFLFLSERPFPGFPKWQSMAPVAVPSRYLLNE